MKGASVRAVNNLSPGLNSTKTSAGLVGINLGAVIVFGSIAGRKKRRSISSLPRGANAVSAASLSPGMNSMFAVICLQAMLHIVKLAERSERITI